MGDRFDTSDDRWSEDSKRFLKDYSENLESQADLIADKNGIEDETELDEVLKNLKDNKEEYLVEYAMLNCSKCKVDMQLLMNNNEKIESIFKNNDISRRIQIVEERTEEINGLVPATVEDCKGGLRDDINKDKKVNIVSFGNCGFLIDGEEIRQIIEQSGCKNNVEDIIEALGKGEGSCYAQYAGIERAIRMPSYMKFDKKEGINMMSMLFCNFGGGYITALESGQDRKSIEERIEELLALIEGAPYDTSDELKRLSTVEILARLIYMESKDKEGQNSIVFSIVNRMFYVDGGYLSGKSNCLYNIITAKSQYDAIISNPREHSDYPYNSFSPPIDLDISKKERQAWENGKRMAALLVIATEDYGVIYDGTKANDRGEKVFVNGDEETHKQVNEFLLEQKNFYGEDITNPINTYRDFAKHEDTDDLNKGIVSGGNYFHNGD